ncbi:MAG TPA: DUF3604 domain-containing protein [Myxococcota bacterium]|nr:DUF3604 domain-containing protein [Myxococcota bacterium]
MSRAGRASAVLLLCFAGCEGSDQPAGEIAGARRPTAIAAAEASAQSDARRALAAQSEAAAGAQKEILFGDLHVHTTYSVDAFLFGLPLFGGEGVPPPADACDYARYCSQLDFFSLNDHAEGLTPLRWQKSIESLRECNARAGDPADPDLVAYVGWEWTQSGTTPDVHFGHKNVIFPGLSDAELPARPISALGDDVTKRARYLWLARGAEAPLSVAAPPYADFLWWIRQLAEGPRCAPGVDVHDLPRDCMEGAADPAVLFEKLAQWRLPSLVIPHGLTWGIHAPPGSAFALQLTRARHDPERQRLLEVYSGHGAAERFDAAAARADDAARRGECLAPTPEFLPCCWQAGEIVRSHCADPNSAGCRERVEEARRFALEAGRDPQWVLPNASVEEWLDCDQVRGEFKSALSPRPYESAQVALSLESADERDANGDPLRFRFGLIGSSDTHSARAGNGFKQVGRKGITDARGFGFERAERWTRALSGGTASDPGRAMPTPRAEAGFRGLLDVERGASFLYPGGLVAVHAAGRDRKSIWDALERREVYATSGPRILLWFDLLNGPDGRAPMGSAVVQRETPRFEARAVGSFAQQPGCPAPAHDALSPERLQRLCLGECYYPSDRRERIAAIEIVRIRPGSDGDVDARIEDPWLHVPCPPDPAGCVIRFEDAEWGSGDRVYYARALQEPTPAINGGNLRTRFDAEGNPVAVTPCFGGWRTPRSDDCLAPVSERAWSSPLFLDAPRP